MKMKKTVLAIMAMSLLVLTQCKKNVEQINNGSTPDGEMIEVVLNAGTNGGDKTTINGLDVKWAVDDKIHVVAADDGYIGCLTAKSAGDVAEFRGIIRKTETTQTYYFYYVGDNEFTLLGGNYTYNVADQYGILSGDGNSIARKHQLMMGSKSITGPSTNDLGSVTLNSMMAILCLDLKVTGTMLTGTDTDANKVLLTGTGCYPTMSLNVKTGVLTPNEAGTITLHKGGGNYNLALIPKYVGNVAQPLSLTFTSNGGEVATITPTIEANHFYNAPTTHSPKVIDMDVPGALQGEYTVNSSGKKVRFSKGNLQYIGSASTPYWKFAENQTDVIGTSQGKSGSNVDRDLFGWGTSNQNYGASSYQPWSTGVIATTYGPSGDLSVSGRSDWGYNAISNGGNTVNYGWRTLTSAEWTYVKGNVTWSKSGIDCRATKVTGLPENTRYAEVQVNGQNGMLLFPDVFDWNTATMGQAPVEVNTDDVSVVPNYTSEQFEAMERAGAVILPRAGMRSSIAVTLVGSQGRYWSSSNASSGTAFYLYSVSNTSIQGDKFFGCSVRLVRDVN